MIGESRRSVGWLTSPLRGELDLDTADRLEPLLLDVAAATDGESVVFDCRNLRFIDTSGTNMLMRVVKRSGKQVRLVNLDEQCHRVFEILGLCAMFGIETRQASESSAL